MLVEFSLKLLPCVVKIFKFMEFTFLENALVLGIFTHAPPYPKLDPKYLSSRPRQQEITHSPRLSILLKICFPQQQKEVEETMIFYIKVQSENMKITWNISFFIFCMICNFFKCNGLRVL